MRIKYRKQTVWRIRKKERVKGPLVQEKDWRKCSRIRRTRVRATERDGEF